MGRVFVTGDTHGNFDFLPYFCMDKHTTRDDVLIIAGDSGILFYGEDSDRELYLKDYISQQPITLFCVRGNHDERPSHRLATSITIKENALLNGEVYVEEKYPNIFYALDGGEYQINDKTILTIGGAYSVDKWYRLMNHWTWFEDEQLTREEMDTILNNTKGKYYDYVITHTCPYELMPTELFLRGIDQSLVDNSMEKFLSKELFENLSGYGHLYFGHFHGEKEIPDAAATMLFHDCKEL